MVPQIVSFNCILKDNLGSVLSTTFNRDIMTASGEMISDPVLSGLVQGLKNLKAGERRQISVPAEKAYGFYDPKKVVIFPRKKFGKDQSLNYGDTIFVMDKKQFKKMYRIIEVHGDLIVLDGNHPLAGQDLVFEIETLEARDATNEEIENSVSIISNQAYH